MDSEKYKQITDSAFKIIRKLISNYEETKELAHTVAIQYFLSVKNTDIVDLTKWINTTARHKAIDHLKHKKIDFSAQAEQFDDIENTLSDNMIKQEEDIPIEEIMEKYKDNLNVQQKQLLTEFANKGYEIKKLWNGKRINHNTLRKRISRLKRDLRADYHLRHGMDASKEMLNSRLYENILYFIRQFKKAVQENSLDRLEFYFSDDKLLTKIPDLQIEKIINFDITLIGPMRYEFTVYYNNLQQDFSAFRTHLEMVGSHSIRIIDFPSKQFSKIIELDQEDFSKDFFEKIKPGKSGKIELSKEQLEKLIKSEAKNVKIIYENPNNTN